MRACASVGAIDAKSGGFAGADRPLVFVDGVVEPRLIVREVRYQGVDDRREAELGFVGDGVVERAVDRWVGRSAAVMVPGRLVDGQVRWGVLVWGVIGPTDRELSAKEDMGGLVVVDGWAEALSGGLPGVWREQDGGLIRENAVGARIRVGGERNRSGVRWGIGGKSVYVLNAGGVAWTVGDALSYLSAVGGLGLSLELLPDEIGDAVLGKSVGLSGAVGSVLRGLLEGYGLVVVREVVFEGGGFVERRAVRPAERGRRVAVGWSDQVIGLDARRVGGGAVLWVVRADGWLVESTFGLVHGWDPALEGGADGLYSKLGNADFATYANVYRLWVLNEDGTFSGDPYLQGARFDLSGLCGGEVVPAGPVRFERCVTLDDSGGRRGVIVEMSTDGGVSWSVYPGGVVVRDDRGAVYLDDADLPAGFLGAAKVGLADVRVTGSVRCPVGVEVRRWTGNPFMGSGERRVVELGGAFRFVRVDAGSIHFDGVRGGSLVADEVDDTAGMTGWLVGQMRRDRRAGLASGGRARLELAGAWPMLRVGDRIVNGGGVGISAGGWSEALGAGGVRVWGVRCRWPVGGGRVESGGRLVTVVDVVY